MENDTLKKEADKVINVTYMLSGVLEQSFQEMDEILAIKHDGFKSVRCRKGKFKEL